MIKIFTINDSSPEYVELQIASFKKYLQEDFEFTLFNSAESIALKPDKAREVSEECKRLSIPVVYIERDDAIEMAHASNPAFGGHPGSLFENGGRYAHIGLAGNYMLQWVWNNVICKEKGIVCFVHSDVFLVEPMNFTDLVKDHTLCSVIQHHDLPGRDFDLTYLWEPFMVIDMSKMPEPEKMLWWPSHVEGMWTDTGGQLHYYLQAHPEIKILEVTQSGCHMSNGSDTDDDPEVDFHPARYRFFNVAGKRLFHYYSGSKWCTDMAGYWNFTQEKSDDYHAKKLAWTRKLIGI